MRKFLVLFALVLVGGVAVAADMKLGTSSDYAQPMAGRDVAGKVYPIAVTDGGRLLGESSANRCDGDLVRQGAIVTDAGVAFLTVAAASYVATQCDVAAYLGTFPLLSDAGHSGCTATTCLKVAAGEVFCSQMAPSSVDVAAIAVSGTATCQVFTGR